MAQHAITAVHYAGGKIDRVAVHTVIDKEFGSHGLSLGPAQRVSIADCANLLALGEEVCILRRTESHSWEIVCDVIPTGGGAGIVGVDIVGQPNDALDKLPSWD
ncbi:hypothetical protein QTI66_14885 [Variovorax sp. J22R133]|uniref:hypothetical protein n=1 Tax=Variovorax brevis TaxID=3053503 RepID=UPI0025766B7F|nr:hypothetical protein [Variovorax sp. J22R133]MDM0113442.1 hypothetical protein [Variovorax sp. J22R133]